MVRFALAGQHLPGSPSVLGVRLTKEKARISGGLGEFQDEFAHCGPIRIFTCIKCSAVLAAHNSIFSDARSIARDFAFTLLGLQAFFAGHCERCCGAIP